MSAWLWLAALFGLFVAALVLALASPIQLRVFATYPSQMPVRADVRWLYGIVDIEELGPSPSARDAEDETESADEEARRDVGASETGQAPRPGEEDEGDPLDRLEGALDSGVEFMQTRADAEKKVKMALAVFRTTDFPLVLARFLRDLVGAVHVDRIGIRAGFGLGSPAETGKIYGQLKAALAWTYATDRVVVDLDPDFYAAGLQGGADVALEARTWDLIRPVIVFALAPPTIRAIKNARRVDGQDED